VYCNNKYTILPSHALKMDKKTQTNHHFFWCVLANPICDGK